MTQAHEQSISGLSDAALIEAVRSGSTEAFGTLYERHLAVARRVSTYLARSDAEREEIVSEAFARILKVLRAGRGPTEEFRPYLLRTMRNLAINTTRQQSPLSLVADMTVYDSPEDAEDPAVADFDRQLITRAFTSLPERWRTVLWHTEVEGEPPAAVAPLLGMSPNGVAALAYRAREGLSRAFLQMHLPGEERLDCRASRAKLGGFVRKSLTDAELQRISDHLDNCDRCRALAADLVEINNDLRAILAPLVLGLPLAAAYLSKSAAAAGTLAATTKPVSFTAKTAGVGGQAIVKVALVLATAVAVCAAASRPDAAETQLAAPAAPAPHIAVPRQAVEQPTPPVPPTSPTPDTPATSLQRTEQSDPPKAPAATAPPTTDTTPPTSHDCRPWQAGPGCAVGRPPGAEAPTSSAPGNRIGHDRNSPQHGSGG
jgi:RNA polymerase sigma factor (sigma-70 family)